MNMFGPRGSAPWLSQTNLEKAPASCIAVGKPAQDMVVVGDKVEQRQTRTHNGWLCA
jgi:hypothetical protein